MASSPALLFASPEFTLAMEAPIEKPDVFLERERQYQNFTKSK